MKRRTCTVAAAAAVAATLTPAPAASAAGCPGADAPIDDQARDRSRAQDALECLVDRGRTAHGRRARGPSSRLGEVAMRHARDMTRRDYVSHVTPGGRDVLDRVRRYTDYVDESDSFRIGEVIAHARGHRATPRDLYAALMESDSHRRVLLMGRLRHVGVEVREGSPVEGRDGVTAVAVLGDR